MEAVKKSEAVNPTTTTMTDNAEERRDADMLANARRDVVFFAQKLVEAENSGPAGVRKLAAQEKGMDVLGMAEDVLIDQSIKKAMEASEPDKLVKLPPVSGVVEEVKKTPTGRTPERKEEAKKTPFQCPFHRRPRLRVVPR